MHLRSLVSCTRTAPSKLAEASKNPLFVLLLGAVIGK
jgi:hypothetical protein